MFRDIIDPDGLDYLGISLVTQSYDSYKHNILLNHYLPAEDCTPMLFAQVL